MVGNTISGIHGWESWLIRLLKLELILEVILWVTSYISSSLDLSSNAITEISFNIFPSKPKTSLPFFPSSGVGHNASIVTVVFENLVEFEQA